MGSLARQPVGAPFLQRRKVGRLDPQRHADFVEAQAKLQAALEDGVLTLRFPREGEIKAFSVSGHDAVLKRVLSSDTAWTSWSGA